MSSSQPKCNLFILEKKHLLKLTVQCSFKTETPVSRRVYSPGIVKFLISFAHVGEKNVQMLDYVLHVTFATEVLSAASLPFFYWQNEKRPLEILLTSYLLSSMSTV